MGCVRQRTPGSFQLLFYVNGKQKSKTVKASKRDADKMLREIERSIDLGTYDDGSKKAVTVGDALIGWLGYVAERRKPSTVHRYRQLVESRLLKEFGGFEIGALGPRDVEVIYKNWGDGGLSPATVRLYHIALSAALRWAMCRELVSRNVASLVPPPKPEGTRSKGVLSDEQIIRLISCSTAMPYGPQAILAVATGLRPGEVSGLKWEDIDWEAGEVNVVRTAVRVGPGEVVLGPPKTKSSRRRVTLDAGTRSMLAQLPREGEFVFGGSSPKSPGATGKGVKRHCAKLGYYLPMHALRSSHASYLNRKGVNPKEVQSRLGHASITETMDTYTIPITPRQDGAASAFNDITMTLTEN